MKQLLVVVALALLAGSAVADRSEKPSAPVTVRIEAAPVPGGYQMKLVAVPTRGVPTLELRLAGKQLAFGATAAGQARELVTFVAFKAGDSFDVIGSAVAAGRNRVASMHVGVVKPRAQKRLVTRTLPDGREVAEAR